MSRPLPFIAQARFRNGLILHARTSGFFGKAIRWAQGRQAKHEGLGKVWGNHDALMVWLAGAWWVCDAEPPVAALTKWDEWEQRVRKGKARVRFYWPTGAFEMDGSAAAHWWLDHVRNSPYDKWAFPRLMWRAVFRPWWKSQAGKDHAWWCTESVRGAWKFAGWDPWGHVNATPLDSEQAVGEGGLEDWTGEICP